MDSETKAAGNGLGCGTVLFMIFMTLKLTHNIDWSWWWVTAPLWVPLSFVALFMCLVVLVALARAVASSK